MKTRVSLGKTQQHMYSWGSLPLSPIFVDTIGVHFDPKGDKSREFGFMLSVEEAEILSEELYQKVREAKEKEWRKRKTRL